MALQFNLLQISNFNFGLLIKLQSLLNYQLVILMKDSLIGQPNIKGKYDYYSNLIKQSKAMQDTLTSFTSSLNTSLQLLPNIEVSTTKFVTLQMQEIKKNVTNMIGKTKEGMIRQVDLLRQMNCEISSISNEFKQLLDLMYYESQKSMFTLKQLGLQLQFKQQEINDGQNILDSNKLKDLQCQWKKKHYLSSNNIPSTITETYLHFLKEFKNKLETQIHYEKKEMGKISNTLISKLKQNRAKLIQIWHSIAQNQVYGFSEIKKVHSQAQNEDIYTPLERAYLEKQKDIDQFEPYDLQSLKKKLKLLQQAEMSESREYLSYSQSESRQEKHEQSQVVGLLQFC